MDARSEFWVITTTRKFAFRHFPERVTITITVAHCAAKNEGIVHGRTHSRTRYQGVYVATCTVDSSSHCSAELRN